MGLHKIAKQMGYKSNADFYKDFPDETSFLRAMGGDLPKYQFGNFLTSQLLSSQNTGLQEQPQGQVQQEAVMPATDPNALGNQAGFQNTQTGFTGTPVNSTAPQEYAPVSGSTAKTVAQATPYGKLFVPIGEGIANAADSVIDEEQNPYLHAAVTQAADPSLGLDQAERTAKKFFQPGVDTDTRMVETTSGADILSGSGIGNLAIKPLEKAGVPIHEGFTKQDVKNALVGRKNGGKLSDGGAIQAGDITAQMIGGQSHEASPMGGTPVDSNGSSTIASGQPAVALAEGGEPAVQFKHADTGEPVSYVFPKNNAEVKKHLKSLERRPNDRTTQTSVNRALTDLMEENEAKNAINSMASLQQAFEPGVPIAKSGINLDPAKKGTFKAMATRMGLSVQAAADKILNAAKGKYSAAMRKKANFAKNFAKEDGGMLNSVLPIAHEGANLAPHVHPWEEPAIPPQYEELGRASIDRTTEEQILAGVGLGAQALPSLLAMQNIPEAESAIQRQAPDLLDLTPSKIAAQAAADRAFSGARRATGEAGGGRQGLLRRLQSLASSEAGTVGQQLTDIETKETAANQKLINRFKDQTFADALREQQRREQGAATEFETMLQLQQNVGDITATGTRDELMRRADDRYNEQAMLALAQRNPDITAVRDPETGELVLKRKINT
jgi:hypothetical protein